MVEIVGNQGLVWERSKLQFKIVVCKLFQISSQISSFPNRKNMQTTILQLMKIVEIVGNQGLVWERGKLQFKIVVYKLFQISSQISSFPNRKNIQTAIFKNDENSRNCGKSRALLEKG